MKRTFIAVMMVLSVISVCFAENTSASLQKDVNDARHQKNLGIGLTVAGGVVLAGTYIFYEVDSVILAVQMDKSGAISSSYQTSVATWAGVSIGGLVVGVCGLAFGIPKIISGAIQQHRAQNALDELGSQAGVSFSPILAYNPMNNDVIVGMKRRY